MGTEPTDRGRLIVAGIAAATVVAIGIAAAVVLSGSLVADTPGADSVQFREIGQSCGLDYRTTGDATGSDDGAVAVVDYDRDGWLDLLAVGGSRPILYENTGASEASVTADDTGEQFVPSGAFPDGEYPPLKSGLFFDADGDGWPDLLLVPKSGEPVFLENDGDAFRRADTGFDVELRWGTGASAADFDGDGDLDVVLIQNGNWTEGTPRRGASGEATDGYPNLLFENTDDGFERVENPNITGSRWSLAVSAVDLTGDGLPDIHVANDYGYDALLVNRGNMSFDRRRIVGTNFHGMSSVVRDVNGDGRLDLFVTNIEFTNPQEVWELNSGLNVRNRGNSLLINRENGTFAELSTEYGVRQGGWGWAAAIEDLDNDGTLDVLHTTKYYLERTAGGNFTGVETRPSLWEEQTNGSFKRRNASAAGLTPANGRGLATFDFDHDGDRDIVVADTSDRFKLYENVDDDGNWLQVRVRDDDAPTLGTRIHVETTNGTITRVQSSRSDFFSQSSRTMHFGLGPTTVENLRIVRPDGTERVFENIEPNQRVVVTANESLTRREVESGGC